MSQSKIDLKTKNLILPETDGLRYFKDISMFEKGINFLLRFKV